MVSAASSGVLPSGRSSQSSLAGISQTKAQFDLTEALKSCRVIQYEWDEFVDRPSRLTVNYEYAPHADKTVLDTAVAQWVLDGLLPVAATMTYTSSSIDVSMLGSAMEDRSAISVEVTYY